MAPLSKSRYIKRWRITNFGIFVFFLLVIDWWWLAFIAKLTLEVLLCYAIMLTRKSKAELAQSKIADYIVMLALFARNDIINLE